jgi:hypothetical protein
MVNTMMVVMRHHARIRVTFAKNDDVGDDERLFFILHTLSDLSSNLSVRQFGHQTLIRGGLK